MTQRPEVLGRPLLMYVCPLGELDRCKALAVDYKTRAYVALENYGDMNKPQRIKVRHCPKRDIENNLTRFARIGLRQKASPGTGNRYGRQNMVRTLLCRYNVPKRPL